MVYVCMWPVLFITLTCAVAAFCVLWPLYATKAAANQQCVQLLILNAKEERCGYEAVFRMQ